MPADAVPFNQRKEIPGRKARERGLVKMPIAADEMRGTRVQICEIAPAAAADRNLPAYLIGAFEHKRRAPPPAGMERAKQAGRAAADDDYVFSHLCFILTASPRSCAFWRPTSPQNNEKAIPAIYRRAGLSYLFYSSQRMNFNIE